MKCIARKTFRYKKLYTYTDYVATCNYYEDKI